MLKPAIGAGSRGTGRFDPQDAQAAEAARAHLLDLHEAGRTVMVQPYLKEVDTAGEAALIYLDGRFSHAITKQAMLSPAAVHALDPGSTQALFVPERITPRSVTTAEQALGDDVMAYAQQRFGPLLYGRVDLLPTPDGPVVIELELIEPSLFLHHAANGADGAIRLAAAIAARLR